MDPVRWFDELGGCASGCGRAATGVLRGPRNESFGHYCRRCADRRLKAAEKERERYYQLTGKVPDGWVMR